MNKFAQRLCYVLAVAGTTLFAAGPTLASIIDFEDATGPSTFAATLPATYSTTSDGYFVTVSLGSLLTATASLPADQTSIYGTANPYCSSQSPACVNPLTISFFDAANHANPKDVTNLFLDVLNGNTVSVDYVLADNLGNSQTFNIPSNLSSGAATVGFAATGSVVRLTANAPPPGACCQWDFFIDNIHFNEGVSAVPEPATIALLGLGLGGLGFSRRKE